MECRLINSAVVCKWIHQSNASFTSKLHPHSLLERRRSIKVVLDVDSKSVVDWVFRLGFILMYSWGFLVFCCFIGLFCFILQSMEENRQKYLIHKTVTDNTFDKKTQQKQNEIQKLIKWSVESFLAKQEFIVFTFRIKSLERKQKTFYPSKNFQQKVKTNISHVCNKAIEIVLLLTVYQWLVELSWLILFVFKTLRCSKQIHWSKSTFNKQSCDLRFKLNFVLWKRTSTLTNKHYSLKKSHCWNTPLLQKEVEFSMVFVEVLSLLQCYNTNSFEWKQHTMQNQYKEIADSSWDATIWDSTNKKWLRTWNQWWIRSLIFWSNNDVRLQPKQLKSSLKSLLLIQCSNKQQL